MEGARDGAGMAVARPARHAVRPPARLKLEGK